jgi:quaternary ammonium compound-resistance protein SugE
MNAIRSRLSETWCQDDLVRSAPNPETTPSTSLEVRMHWVLLFLAGILEIGWAVGLKYTEGFTRFWPTVATVAAMIASLALLGLAVRGLPLGTAYAVWTGVGTVGTALLGMALLGEPANALRLGCIALIAGGIVGLKVLH